MREIYRNIEGDLVTAEKWFEINWYCPNCGCRKVFIKECGASVLSVPTFRCAECSFLFSFRPGGHTY